MPTPIKFWFNSKALLKWEPAKKPRPPLYIFKG